MHFIIAQSCLHAYRKYHLQVYHKIVLRKILESSINTTLFHIFQRLEYFSMNKYSKMPYYLPWNMSDRSHSEWMFCKWMSTTTAMEFSPRGRPVHSSQKSPFLFSLLPHALALLSLLGSLNSGAHLKRMEQNLVGLINLTPVWKSTGHMLAAVHRSRDCSGPGIKTAPP